MLKERAAPCESIANQERAAKSESIALAELAALLESIEKTERIIIMENSVNYQEVLSALRELKPGETVVYHEGFLDDDRNPASKSKHPQHVEINQVANEVYEGYLKGELELIQRRLGPTIRGQGPGFAYIATRRVKNGPDIRERKREEDALRRQRIRHGSAAPA